MMEIRTVCPFCGKENVVYVAENEYRAWQNGACIQDAMPDLTPDERELVKTGICSACWDAM